LCFLVLMCSTFPMCSTYLCFYVFMLCLVLLVFVCFYVYCMHLHTRKNSQVGVNLLGNKSHSDSDSDSDSEREAGIRSEVRQGGPEEAEQWPGSLQPFYFP